MSDNARENVLREFILGGRGLGRERVDRAEPEDEDEYFLSLGASGGRASESIWCVCVCVIDSSCVCVRLTESRGVTTVEIFFNLCNNFLSSLSFFCCTSLCNHGNTLATGHTHLITLPSSRVRLLPFVSSSPLSSEPSSASYPRTSVAVCV